MLLICPTSVPVPRNRLRVPLPPSQSRHSPSEGLSGPFLEEVVVDGVGTFKLAGTAAATTSTMAVTTTALRRPD